MEGIKLMDVYEKYKNTELIKNMKYNFDIEIKGNKVYDQKSSFTCCACAAFNVISGEVAKALNVEANKMVFSVNYVSFYERIEKIDKLYDEIINGNYGIDDIKYLLFDYLNIGSADINTFKYIVEKYGVVYEWQMPMVDNNYIPSDVTELLKQKIVCDVDELLEAKKYGKDVDSLKNKYHEEIYDILKKIYGEPPTVTIINNIELPVKEFYKKYIHRILQNMVGVCSLDNLEYNKYYDNLFVDGNISSEGYLNLELNTIKNAIINSLKDGIPVWFGCDFRYISCSYKNVDGILDDQLYKFDKLGINKLPRELVEKYNLSMYDHAMVFVGYDSENKNWKVLNSFGENNNKKGYFVMSDNFFNSSVFLCAINRSYL